MKLCFLLVLIFLLVSVAVSAFASPDGEGPVNSRKPVSPEDLRYWLENMVWYHRFTTEEIVSATGLSPTEIHNALKQFHISPRNRPKRAGGAPLLTLPYPGGRHPRIGFLEGAVRPQRETKISVFTPWDPNSYVVVDVPEALWSNLGLTYLAHTHVPTIWTQQNVMLEPREWSRRPDGTLECTRTLPNGIAFGVIIKPSKEAVWMEMWLTNGTKATLSDLRVQMCVMLKEAKGFEAQSNDNKVLSKPYAACRSGDGKRWVIEAWEPCNRVWGNPPCPCLHSDPQFPDCAPGQTQRLHGLVSFYEGKDIEAELHRLDATGWRNRQP